MEEHNIIFDYYNGRFSYMKLIMDKLNRHSIEKTIIGEIFNTFLSRLDSNEIHEIVIYSSLFENKINSLGNEQKMMLLNNLYNCYIKNMILNFSNGDMDAVIYFFKDLEEKIKIYSCYYGLYGEDGYFKEKNQRITIR